MTRLRTTSAAGPVVPVALLALLALTGCSGDEPRVEEPAAADEPGRALGLTPPGTELEVGDTARIPLEERLSADGDPNVIDLTVTSVVEGDPSTLERLPGTPWFVRMTFTAVSGDAQRFFPADVISAWSEDTEVDLVASPITVGGCTRTGFTAPSPPLGRSLDTCVTFVVEPGGDPIDRVGYDDDVYDDQDGTAVVWR